MTTTCLIVVGRPAGVRIVGGGAAVPGEPVPGTTEGVALLDTGTVPGATDVVPGTREPGEPSLVGAGVAVDVEVDVEVGVAVEVGVEVGVAVSVGVGESVAVGVGDEVAVGVGVAEDDGFAAAAGHVA